jgi:hypothetical protein
MLHNLRTELTIPDGETVLVDIVFSYTPSGDEDYSDEMGFLSVKRADGATSLLDLRGAAEAAFIVDDQFYDRLRGAARADCRIAPR